MGPRLHRTLRRLRVAAWRFKRSPEQQDRAAMYATFAFIGLFAVGSVDAVVTGGADFAPGSAYAAEYRATQISARAAPLSAAAEESKPADTAKSAEGAAIDYSTTTEVLLGGPEIEIFATPLFEDVLAEGVKVEQPVPAAAAETDAVAS